MTQTPSLHTRKHHLAPFWRHFLQMLAVMMIGMFVGAAVLVTVEGAKTWDEVTTEYGTQALVVMAVSMTVPMTAWMLSRGMGSRNAYEMAAVMVLPVVPLLCLYWFDVTKSAQCGAYCALSVAAMLALMFYRRTEYSTSM
jgi:hypothetical protein